MPATLRSARFAALVLFLVALVSAIPARAGLFDDEEARKRIEATTQRLNQLQAQADERLRALEVRVQGMVDLANQMEQLRGDLAKMRGQIEVLGYELEQLQKRQRDLYVDLDSRLRRLETAPAPAAAEPAGAAGPSSAPPAGTGAPPVAAPPPTGPVSTTAPPPAGSALPATPPPVPGMAAAQRPADAAGEQRAYDSALDLFRKGDYPGAINGFGAFVKAYPRSPLASSAQYWMGNAYYARRDYRAAITAQRTLVSAYPDSAKVPDALLVIASAQSDLGDGANARRTLEDLVAKYPQSDAAKKAKQRLGAR